MRNVFLTVGHATRPIQSFADLLRQSQVRTVIDVRAMPRSRANPQFNHDVLSRSLGPLGIEYQHIPELGGMRGKQKDVPFAVNGFWENPRFHNYADYAMGAEFRSGLQKLLILGRERQCAIMCAETLWWRCHRRIIADYLIAAGETVFHILGPGQIEQAHMTKSATPAACGVLTYPAKV